MSALDPAAGCDVAVTGNHCGEHCHGWCVLDDGRPCHAAPARTFGDLVAGDVVRMLGEDVCLTIVEQLGPCTDIPEWLGQHITRVEFTDGRGVRHRWTYRSALIA